MPDAPIDEAYRLAADHGLTEGSNFADLEWLAGYLALTYLDDPEAAVRHFQRFRASVGTPISLGRAGYWEGRAWEALGNPEAAQAAYEFGGAWQTSFYGLLAAEKAGLSPDPALAGVDPRNVAARRPQASRTAAFSKPPCCCSARASAALPNGSSPISPRASRPTTPSPSATSPSSSASRISR